MYGANWQSEQWERERARAIRTKRNATMRPTAPIPTPTTPQSDLARFLPSIPIPTGPRHTAFWSWLASVPRGIKPSARVEIWPRGGAKSTCAELAAVWTALTLRRSFVLYVSGTQAQADMHLQTVSAYLERCGIRRAVNAYNASRGWTAQMLRTEHGWNALSVGLDGPIRGAKLDELRPDLIVLDDIDARHDSQALTAKKLRTITQTILPAGSPDAAVLFVQNKIHADSCIAQVWDGRADVLLDRAGTCEPAIDGLVTERRDGRYVVVSGVPTWTDGQGLDVCQAQMNEWGLSAFLSESQHEDATGGGIWNTERDIVPYRVATAPHLDRIVIGVDPPGGATECGIVAMGRGGKRLYCLRDASLLPDSPGQWARVVVGLYHELHADAIVAEKNFGGDMVKATIEAIPGAPRVILVSASRGKAVRAEPIQRRAQEGEISHVGTFPALERELTTWQPGMSSPNRLDAYVWAGTELTTPCGIGLIAFV